VAGQELLHQADWPLLQSLRQHSVVGECKHLIAWQYRQAAGQQSNSTMHTTCIFQLSILIVSC
jgi:hypothetical protein